MRCGSAHRLVCHDGRHVHQCRRSACRPSGEPDEPRIEHAGHVWRVRSAAAARQVLRERHSTTQAGFTAEAIPKGYLRHHPDPDLGRPAARRAAHQGGPASSPQGGGPAVHGVDGVLRGPTAQCGGRQRPARRTRPALHRRGDRASGRADRFAGFGDGGPAGVVLQATSLRPHSRRSGPHSPAVGAGGPQRPASGAQVLVVGRATGRPVTAQTAQGGRDQPPDRAGVHRRRHSRRMRHLRHQQAWSPPGSSSRWRPGTCCRTHPCASAT